MTRPTRNIVFWLVVLFVPPLIGLRALAAPISLACLGLLVFLIVYGRDFFIARSLDRRKRWQEAIERYKAFEARAARFSVGRFEIPVFLSIYTYSGVALAKNNMAFCYMNAGDLEEAERLCREALELDGKYAVPYVNLGIIAALRGDASASAECLERGFRLGYRNRGIQKQVQQILARVNVDLGDVLAD